MLSLSSLDKFVKVHVSNHTYLAYNVLLIVISPIPHSLLPVLLAILDFLAPLSSPTRVQLLKPCILVEVRKLLGKQSSVVLNVFVSQDLANKKVLLRPGQISRVVCLT